MFWRNLLFLTVVGVCGLALAASLLPDGVPRHWQAAKAQASTLRKEQGFQTTLVAFDRLFRQRWQELGIEPAPRADELTILRRLSLALTGTIPSLEEIRMIQRERREQPDVAAQDTADLVDWWTAGLLQDRRSSDYLAERFARAYVGTDSGPSGLLALLYRRRRFVSWLAEELQNNRPYDQIVQELIVSDGLWTNVPATNFITVTIPGAEGIEPDETKLAARVYRAFLGIRIDCAQCHDHPFHGPTPDTYWTQEDFHNLSAFFGRAELSFTGIHEGKGRYEWEVHDPTDEEIAAAEKAAREKAAREESGEENDDELSLTVTRLGTPGVPFKPQLLPRQGNRRQRLAGWVTHEKNKTFARATVNRVWALMFGRPAIEPVDDIPFEVPQDREDPNWLGMQALDILAADFIQHRYDLNRLFQLIAASEAFQRDCSDNPSWSDEQLDAALENWAVFKLTRLRPEQVVGALLQACSVKTNDYESHILQRIVRGFNESAFVARYGDAGGDELLPHGGTIPQRLLMLNGNLVKNNTRPAMLTNAATQIAAMAPDDKTAVECAYLSVLTRLPTQEESDYFQSRLKDTRGDERQQVLEDIFVTLLNPTEFSWHH